MFLYFKFYLFSLLLFFKLCEFYHNYFIISLKMFRFSHQISFCLIICFFFI
jgi:hypothetical protein